MTGSIKDRMTYYIRRCAYKNGSIAPGHTIVEASSGNTGISFAALGPNGHGEYQTRQNTENLHKAPPQPLVGIPLGRTEPSALRRQVP
jgi:hypothetical protein